MGVLTDAYLFFGFEFFDPEADHRKPPFALENWESEYAARCGIKDDSGLFSPDGEYAVEENTPEYQEAHAKWEAYCKAEKRALAVTECLIETHRSGDSPVYFVTHQNHLERAGRGHPLVIPEGRFKVKEHEIRQMMDFCKRLDIPWQEPKWILASYWG